ncbi:Uma2 family endonuclease [Flavihumibacter sp. R14]|nr:Uma2 family endonuclease [Flavihumibacter soli]
MEGYKLEDKVLKFEDIDLSASYTYADYLKWEFDERLELIRGKVFRMSPGPNTFHQQVSGAVFYALYNFLRKKPCKVFAAPYDVRFPRQSKDDKEIITVLQPDICVICDPGKIDARGGIGAPDIVIEILSPGNNKKDLQNKYEVYEEAGVREYWIIHPVERTFIKYTLDTNGKFQPSRFLTLGDEVTSPVLLGFSLVLDEVFED